MWIFSDTITSTLKEINPKYSLEGLMLKLQYSGHLMRRTTSLEKTMMLGKIEGRRRSGRQRKRCLDSITNSMDKNLSKFPEAAEAEISVLQSMGSQSQTQITHWTTTSFYGCLRGIFFVFFYSHPICVFESKICLF